MPRSRYNIPHSNPPTALSFTSMRAPQVKPSIVLLSIIEQMQPVCRHFADPFPPSWVFDYALIRVTIQNLYLSCGPLTYNDACTALRGLAEFMVLQTQFYQWRFQIWVGEYAVGGGQIDGLVQVLPAAGPATS